MCNGRDLLWEITSLLDDVAVVVLGGLDDTGAVGLTSNGDGVGGSTCRSEMSKGTNDNAARQLPREENKAYQRRESGGGQGILRLEGGPWSEAFCV